MEKAEKLQGQCATESRNLALDVMNLLSCIAVIALHHNGLVHSYTPGLGWVQSLVVECLCYCAVPIFLMISGANLMDYRDKYDTRSFFKKRMQRVVFPWLAWSIIVLLWQIGTGQRQTPGLHEAVKLILSYQVLSIYWFFGVLIACYLAIPVLSLLRRERAALWYIVLLNFIFLSCLPYLSQWLMFSWTLDVPLVGSLIVFVLLGYLLSTQELSTVQRCMLYTLGLASVLFRFGYTLRLSALQGHTDVSIKSYGSFHSVLYAAAVFVLGLHMPWARVLPAAAQRMLPKLAACSFGVYLIHRVVMYYEERLLGLGDGDWSWRILCIPLTYLLSVTVVAGLRRIPGIRRLVG